MFTRTHRWYAQELLRRKQLLQTKREREREREYLEQRVKRVKREKREEREWNKIFLQAWVVKNAFVLFVPLNELRYRGQTVLLDDVFVVVVVVVFSIDKITTTTEKSDRGVVVDFF